MEDERKRERWVISSEWVDEWVYRGAEELRESQKRMCASEETSSVPPMTRLSLAEVVRAVTGRGFRMNALMAVAFCLLLSSHLTILPSTAALHSSPPSHETELM